MKRFVNDEELDLPELPFPVTRLADRILVHTPTGTFSAVAISQGDATLISYKGKQYRVERSRPRGKGGSAIGSGEMRAPMPGLIVDVKANVGQVVLTGDTLLVLEAMKTQQPFVAPFEGIVKELPVKKGDQVAEGDLLALIERANAPIIEGR